MSALNTTFHESDLWDEAISTKVFNRILCIHAGLLSLKYRRFPEEIQEDTINVRLRKIVESGNNGGVEAVQKVLDLYKSCMDTATIESRGIQPLFELINQTGGYDVM